jgi:hypothetical protein
MNITVTITSPVIAPPIPPEIAGRRGFILHDFQSAENNYTIWREYLPETEKFGEVMFEKMEKARQLFWFGFLKLYAAGTKTDTQLKSIWSGITAGNKAFCNKHGGTKNPPVPANTNMFIDYINNTGNMDSPMSQENLTTCGNKIILTGNKKSIGGTPFLGFWCLDSLAAMPVNLESHALLDYFIHAATTVTPDAGSQPNFPRNSIAPNGTYKCNPFPNLDGRKVPVPIFSARGITSEIMGIKVRENWLREDRICNLDDDENPSPYVR